MIVTHTNSNLGANNFDIILINELIGKKNFYYDSMTEFNKKNTNSTFSDTLISKLTISNYWNLIDKSLSSPVSNRNTTSINRITSEKTSISKHAYKISIIKLPKKDLSKEELNDILINTKTYTDTLDIKFDTDFNELTRSSIICPSIFSKNAKGMSDNDVLKSNFIFLDIDDGLSIEEVTKILDEKYLSYLLFTSASHTDEVNRFHILVPLLKSVSSKYEYKGYFNYLNLLLKSKTDKICNHPARACYPSLSTGITIDKLFRNDLFLSAKELNKYVKIEKAIDKIPTTSNIKVSEGFFKSLYSLKPELILVEKTDKFIRFKRDKNDKFGNVIYYIDQDKQVLFDISKNIQIDLLFSNEAFNDSILAEESRIKIKEDIKYSLELHFLVREQQIDSGLAAKNKTIIVANEGIGKSETVISLCDNKNIIYAAHTIKRVEEIKSSFIQKGISFNVCLSNEEIFKEFNLDEEFISLYKEECRKGITTTQFVENNFKGTDELKIAILKRIEENNNLLLRRDCNIIITIAKLKRLLLKFSREINLSTIVLDEFEASDFYSVITEPYSTTNKGHIHNCLYSEATITVYKNRHNLIDLLKFHSVVILSTERSKIERIFYKNEDYDIRNYSRLLDTNNVIYKLVHSTSGIKKDDVKIRDLVIQKVKTLYPFIDEVIVNSSNEATSNHLQVRGSNDYIDKNTLVVATVPCPQEQKLFELNCKDFYEAMPLKDIQNDINSTLISCQINQSIGRNSGFREKGKKCIVVLPILAPNSDGRFKGKRLDLTYISSNIEYLAS